MYLKKDTLGFTLPSEAMGWLFSGGSSVSCDLPEVSAEFSSEFSWSWATQTAFILQGRPPGALMLSEHPHSGQVASKKLKLKLRSLGSRGELILHPNGRGSLCCPRRVAGWSLPRRLSSMSAPCVAKTCPLSLLATELTLLAVRASLFIWTQNAGSSRQSTGHSTGDGINFLSLKERAQALQTSHPESVCQLELAFKCQFCQSDLASPSAWDSGLLELQDFLSSNMVNPMPTGMNSSPSL